MPLIYRITPHLHLLFIRGDGVIAQRERVAALRAWLTDPEYPECTTALCDFTRADSVPTMAELRELVTIISGTKSRGPTKLAIATAKPITFGVAREFKAFVEIAGVSIEVGVFADVESAWAWLQPGETPPDMPASG